MLQERPKPDSSTFLGSGKIVSLAAACAETTPTSSSSTTRAHAGAAAPHRGGGSTQDHRSHAAHPRHLRQTGATRKGSCRWSCQLKLPAPRLVGAGAAAVAARRRHRHTGTGETKLETDRRQIRTRIHAVSEDIEHVRQRRRSFASGATRRRCRPSRWSATRTPGRPRCSIRAGARRRRGVQRVVRHARSAVRRAAAGQPRAAGVRHGRFTTACRDALAASSSYARGSGRCGSRIARDRCGGDSTATADRAVHQVLQEVGANDADPRRSSTNAMPLPPTSAGACRIRIPPHCVCRRCSGRASVS